MGAPRVDISTRRQYIKYIIFGSIDKSYDSYTSYIRFKIAKKKKLV